MSSLISLPNELLVQVSEYLTNKHDLGALCQVSSQFKALGQQILFRSVVIRDPGTDTPDLIQFLTSRPEVAKDVHELHIKAPMEPADLPRIVSDNDRHGNSARPPAMPILPNLKVLKIVSKSLNPHWLTFPSLEILEIDCLQHDYLPRLRYDLYLHSSINDITLLVGQESFMPGHEAYGALLMFLANFKALIRLQVRASYARALGPATINMNNLIERLYLSHRRLKALIIQDSYQSNSCRYKCMNEEENTWGLKKCIALEHIVLPPWALIYASSMTSTTMGRELSSPVESICL
ncbi:hypothetical protein NX059_012371 [Plenodomus lindquistii]|nr:hypothetical protein NX059_012371 [Plenodomus lindquistii]